MLVALAALLFGIALLAVAADQFVLGAARVALIRRVPSIVVGIVIVGFGTSAPEMLVSGLAVFNGDIEVAVGNVLGSNLANLSLLLGVGACLSPLAVTSSVVRREAPLVVGAVVAFGLAVQDGGIDQLEGALLLLAMMLAIWLVMRGARSSPTAPDELASGTVELAAPAEHQLQTEILRTVAGIVGTIGAAQLLLWAALDLADRAGLSEGFVGATLVAVGTSLPELVTVVQSARRGETDLIVGNLLGSNLFNALAVGGLIGVIGGSPLVNTTLSTTAVIASIFVAVVAAVAMYTSHTITRREGGLLVVAYAAITPLLL